MFNSRTTIVLGAGSSNEVGLPVGEKLAARISKLMDVKFSDGYTPAGSGDTQIYECLKRLNQSNPNSALRAMWAIKEGVLLADSIDTFLDRHRNDENIKLAGKLGIIKSIAIAESQSLLNNNYTTNNGKEEINLIGIIDTWFVRFFRIISRNVDHGTVSNIFNNLTIINFNYDRCIEYYLFRSLIKGFLLSETDSRQIMASLNIIHPYGTIGTEFGAFGKTPDNLLEAARGVRTFTEQVHSMDAENIQEAITHANTLIFLGFAFHEINVKLLTTSSFGPKKDVYATVLGSSRADQSVIEELIMSMLPNRRAPVKITLENSTCSDFVRDYQRVLTSA